MRPSPLHPGILGLAAAFLLCAAVRPSAAQRLPTVEPIAAVRIDANHDGIPDRLGDTVAVRGAALVGTGALHVDQLDAAIRDSTGAIFLFAPGFREHFVAGDTVEAWGVVSQYDGKTQIQVTGYRVQGHGPPPPPLELNPVPTDLEPLEARLVRFHARIVSKGRNQGGSFLVVMPDASPDHTLTVFARAAAPVATALDAFSPSESIDVTGVVGQFDPTPPYHEGYQIYPRSAADLKREDASRTFLERLAWIGLVLLVAALAWSFVLRREVRKQTDALRASEAQTRLLMDRSPGAVLVLADGQILYANRAAGDLFGATIPEGSSLARLLSADGVAALVDSGLTDAAVPWQGRLETNEGNVVEVEAWATAVTYDGRPARQVWIHDVSERNRHLREREALAEQVRETRRLESVVSLAGGLAHGYNNLMASVMGNAGLLAETGGLGADERGLVQGIEEAAQGASDLTRRLLQLAGKAGLQRRATDLSRLVAEVSNAVAESRGTTSPNLDVPEPVTILGDPDQLSEMIRSLLANAYEAVGERGDLVTVSTRLEELTELRVKGRDLVPGRYARITVEDRGPGLPPDVQRRAFDPMFSTRELGRGLGLPTARGIAEAHGGGIVLQSGPDGGVRVDVYLPST